MKGKKFAVAINCMDGRVQTPVTDWMKKHLGVDYVDMITEPGADKLLSQGQREKVDALRAKAQISMAAHGATTIAIVGHDDCAGNPVSKEEHLKQLNQCVAIVSSWGLSRILGLWVNERWEVEVVYDTARASG